MDDSDDKNLGKVLVVEDDKFIARAYKDGLERIGCKVAVASSGLEAVEMVKSDKPDLILLDLIIPGLDGFGVLEQLRQVDELKEIPILVLSNLSQNSDIEKAKELGATDYLTKATYSMKDVINKVKEYVGKK